MSIKDNPEVLKIHRCCANVAAELRRGYIEAVYKDAMELEFQAAHIPYKREATVRIGYKGQVLRSFYKADFVCFDKIIVEVKALKTLNSEHKAQVLNYLRATNLSGAYLVNFGYDKGLQYDFFPNDFNDPRPVLPITKFEFGYDGFNFINNVS